MTKKIFLISISILLLSQLLQPSKNEGEYTLVSFYTDTNPPNDVKEVLLKACYDCHSNHTRYPWYFSITPVNYRIQAHVDNGKEYLNFSEWKKYNKNQKERALEEIIDVINQKEMPLKTYILLHDEAVITDKKAVKITEWAKKAKVRFE